MTPPGLGVVLVGAGGFGRCWLPALKRYGLGIEAVVDPDSGMAESFAAELGLERKGLHCSLDEALARDAALVIDSAPPRDRVERVMRALEAGKDVLAAKPLSWDAEAVSRVARASVERGRRVWVAMQKRYLPAYQRLRLLLPSLGEIGYVGIDLQVDGRAWESGMDWRLAMELPSLYEGAIHHLDLLLWLFDPKVKQVWATAWNPAWSGFRHADFCAVLECGGPTIHYLSRWAARGAPFSTYFSGLRVEGVGGVACVQEGVLYRDGRRADPVGEDPMMNLEALNERLLGDVLRDLASEGSDPSLTAEFHARVLELADRVAGAIRRSRRSTR